jgi:hypothetical protein
MSCFRYWIAAALVAASSPARAFESDVHYGLTQWLALQAGFDAVAARIIATGDQRVDSGDMQFLDPVFFYACGGADDDFGARRAGRHHFPSAGAIPAPPGERVVVAGGDVAKKDAVALVGGRVDQASFMLHKLGEALHTLQDSWSHQGVPDVPVPGAPIACDATRAWAHPKARGGWNSHRADLTAAWPADTVAAAKATYDILAGYPMPPGARKNAKPWNEVAPLLDRFAKAATKTEKKAWFAAQGVADVTFLEGISVPDGAEPFDATWPGRKLPPLPSAESRQHATDAGLLDYFNRFFARWMTTEDFNELAVEFGGVMQGARAKKPAADTEIATRLKLWRMRDHGRVADIAHSVRPLTKKQRAAIDAGSKAKGALARYDAPGDAFFPLAPRGKEASPLLPYYVSAGAAPAGENPRAVAWAKLRHAPYDVVAIVAERADGRWRLVAVTSVVDH